MNHTNYHSPNIQDSRLDNVDPWDWNDFTDAYLDLAEFARANLYKRMRDNIEDQIHIEDVVIEACEKAFKCRENFDETKGNISQWFSMIISSTWNNKYNKLYPWKAAERRRKKREQAEKGLIQDGHIIDIKSRGYERYIENKDYNGYTLSSPYEDSDDNRNDDLDISPEEHTMKKQARALSKEVVDVLYRNIEKLKPKDIGIFTQAVIDNVAYKTIAEEYGMTETAIRKRVFDIKKKLRTELEGLYGKDVIYQISFQKCRRAKGHPEPIDFMLYDSGLLQAYPQYIPEDDTEEWIAENLDCLIADLEWYLQSSLDEYRKDEGSFAFSELQNELTRRGYKTYSNEDIREEHFIIKDELDLIVFNNLLYIGFLNRLFCIPLNETSVNDCVDFIEDIHYLLDSVGDIIDMNIAIKSI